MKILIINENTEYIEHIRSNLDPNWACDEATSTESAISTFLDAWKSGFPYDVIICAGLYGSLVVQKLRKIEKKRTLDAKNYARMVVLRQDGCFSSIMDAYERGANLFIKDPFSKKALIAQLAA